MPSIDALNALGVFDGTECAKEMFCPGEEMKRWTMAVGWCGSSTTKSRPLLPNRALPMWTPTSGGCPMWSGWPHSKSRRAAGSTRCATARIDRCRGPRWPRSWCGVRPRSRSPGRVHRHVRQHPRNQHRRTGRGRGDRRLHHRAPELLPCQARVPGPDGHVPSPRPGAHRVAPCVSRHGRHTRHTRCRRRGITGPLRLHHSERGRVPRMRAARQRHRHLLGQQLLHAAERARGAIQRRKRGRVPRMRSPHRRHCRMLGFEHRLRKRLCGPGRCPRRDLHCGDRRR